MKPVLMLTILSILALSGCAPKSVPITNVEISFHEIYYNESGNIETDERRKIIIPKTYTYYLDENGFEGFFLKASPIADQSCMELSMGLHPVVGSKVINFKMDAQCTRRFAKITTDNIGKRLAVIMNGEVTSSPQIATPIISGTGFIEGDYSKTE